MVVFGCRLCDHLFAGEVELKVQMFEHSSVLHASVREHFLDAGFVLKRNLKLLEQLLDRWLVFVLPLLLADLLLGDSLREHAGKVILMDH